MLSLHFQMAKNAAKNGSMLCMKVYIGLEFNPRKFIIHFESCVEAPMFYK